MIKKRGNKWCIYSKTGEKNLGCYYTKEAANRRLRQIEYFKHNKSE